MGWYYWHRGGDGNPFGENCRMVESKVKRGPVEENCDKILVKAIVADSEELDKEMSNEEGFG